jgi:hypothetical protein
MATVKKMKYQTGGDVPKGMVRGERSEGKLYKKADQDKWDAGMADALDRQAGLGKYAPKKNDAIKNKPLKEGKLNSDGKPKAMKSGGKVVKAVKKIVKSIKNK